MFQNALHSQRQCRGRKYVSRETRRDCSPSIDQDNSIKQQTLWALYQRSTQLNQYIEWCQQSKSKRHHCKGKESKHSLAAKLELVKKNQSNRKPKSNLVLKSKLNHSHAKLGLNNSSKLKQTTIQEPIFLVKYLIKCSHGSWIKT